MGGTKDMWIAEHEAIPDRYHENLVQHGEEYARSEAERQLRLLGFDQPEIQEQLDALLEECPDCGAPNCQTNH